MNQSICRFIKSWRRKLWWEEGERGIFIYSHALSLLSPAAISNTRSIFHLHQKQSGPFHRSQLRQHLHPCTTQTNQQSTLSYHKKMASRAPSNKAPTKVSAKTRRIRRQRKEQQPGPKQWIRNLLALPPTFRCWFCVSEKRLEEQAPDSRTVPICHNCHEYYSNVVSEQAVDAQPTAAFPAFPQALPPSQLQTTPTPAHSFIPSRPLRLAVVIDPSKGLKKKIILRLKTPKKPNALTSNKGPEEEKEKKVRPSLTAPKKLDVPKSNEGLEEKKKKKKVRLSLTAPKEPLLFLSLPKRKGEKIFPRFPNPLNKKKIYRLSERVSEWVRGDISICNRIEI